MEPEKLFIGKLLSLTFSSSSCDTLSNFEVDQGLSMSICVFVLCELIGAFFQTGDAARLFSFLSASISGYLQMLQRRSTGCKGGQLRIQ